MFEIQKKDKNTHARTGILSTMHGEVHTPAFFPVGSKGSVKTLSNDELIHNGSEMILANTYHLWIAPGDEIIRELGGLHKFMGWTKGIITDSGGFQIFSLGRARMRVDDGDVGFFNVHINERGVSFQRGSDGNKMLLTPEKSVQIQSNLGSDIALVLDEFTSEIEDYDKVNASVERTFRWAQRAKDEFIKIKGGGVNPGQFLLGIVQGGVIAELREKSAKQIRELGFDGYAIGGVAVGGESAQMQYKAVDMSVPYLEEDKFKHLLGVGTPEQIVQSVARGCDSFDCVIPTREARHGRLYISSGLGYTTIDISKGDYLKDTSLLDVSCDCYTCTNYSRAYLHYLYRSRELLGLRLLTLHNVRFYLRLMENIRNSIETGNFKDLLGFKKN